MTKQKQKQSAGGMETAQAEAAAGSETFMKVAIMPAILLVIFIIILYSIDEMYYKQQKKAHA